MFELSFNHIQIVFADVFSHDPGIPVLFAA